MHISYQYIGKIGYQIHIVNQDSCRDEFQSMVLEFTEQNYNNTFTTTIEIVLLMLYTAIRV